MVYISVREGQGVLKRCGNVFKMQISVCGYWISEIFEESTS